MGGGSGSNANSASNTVYTQTTTKNPYVKSTTNNFGTTTTLNDGTAYKSIYDYTNKNIDELLEEYRHPTINTPTNQALLQNYTNQLNKQSKEALENNVINPLANRNMIRSSQATDMYNHLADSMNESIADYTAELLANSQNNAGNMINLLMNAYLQGHNAVNGNQALSLQTSAGNASTTGTSKSSGYSYGL